MEISGWKKREKTEKNIWNKNEWEAFKINDRYQTIDPEILEKTKGDIYIYTHTHTHTHIISNLKEIKEKEEILKEARGWGDKLPVLEQGWEWCWTSQKPCKNRDNIFEMFRG